MTATYGTRGSLIFSIDENNRCTGLSLVLPHAESGKASVLWWGADYPEAGRVVRKGID
jgi:hypothetical protein